MFFETSFRRTMTLLVLTAAMTTPVAAQGLGKRLPNAQSQTQRRLQAQVQQRVQTQVQQSLQTRVQAQVQQRVQAQVAGGLQSRLQDQVQASARQAARLAVRTQLQANRQSDRAVTAAERPKLDININAKTNASSRNRSEGRREAKRGEFANRTNGGLNASIRSIQFTTADVQAYDSVFGQYNPLRTAGVVNANAMAAANAQSHMNVQATGQTDDLFAFGPSEPPRRADSETLSEGRRRGPQNSNRPSDRRDNVDAPNRGLAIAGEVGGNVDFASMIVAAARQRRAEISQIRDKAIASANANLMAQADQMESQLDAFASAQQQMTASAANNTTSLEVDAIVPTPASATTTTTSATPAEAASASNAIESTTIR